MQQALHSTARLLDAGQAAPWQVCIHMMNISAAGAPPPPPTSVVVATCYSGSGLEGGL